jgi:ABC-type lipopolysaccharide export system ATPase subunit
MPTVIVEHISKHFGDTEAVKGVSFDVNPGEIFGLLGPKDQARPPSSVSSLIFTARIQAQSPF